MLRAAVATGTDVGKQAKQVMERGELVPTTSMVAHDRRAHRPAGLRQAASSLTAFRARSHRPRRWTRMLAERGLTARRVIEMAVDERGADRADRRSLCLRQVRRRLPRPVQAAARGRRVRRLRRHRVRAPPDDKPRRWRSGWRPTAPDGADPALLPGARAPAAVDGMGRSTAKVEEIDPSWTA